MIAAAVAEAVGEVDGVHVGVGAGAAGSGDGFNDAGAAGEAVDALRRVGRSG
jgi:hypothetical protein